VSSGRGENPTKKKGQKLSLPPHRKIADEPTTQRRRRRRRRRMRKR
jgi:hypothetical protein